jgi:hypothetical protein
LIGDVTDKQQQRAEMEMLWLQVLARVAEELQSLGIVAFKLTEIQRSRMCPHGYLENLEVSRR